MRIGILADIHGDVESLTGALTEFRARGVDQVVSLGDACEMFGPDAGAREVVDLLRSAHAVGVWGNHDFGLCYEVEETVRQEAGSTVIEFMAGMRPHLVLEGCRFSHVEPWLDPTEVQDLWYWQGPPDTPELAARSFAAVPERFLFIGHFHAWLAMTPSERREWRGEGPLDLSVGPRDLVVIDAVHNGWCAIFDTTTAVLTPVRCQA